MASGFFTLGNYNNQWSTFGNYGLTGTNWFWTNQTQTTVTPPWAPNVTPTQTTTSNTKKTTTSTTKKEDKSKDKSKKKSKTVDKTVTVTPADTSTSTTDTSATSTSTTDVGDSDSDSLSNGNSPTMAPITIETVQDVYDKLFTTVGKVDDNNDYVTKPSRELNSVQLSEPTISVDEMVVSDKEKTAAQDIPERMAFRFPLVYINEQMVNQKNVQDFELDYTGFVPTLMVELMDFNNELLSTNSIRDGSIIKIYLGGMGDELYYKPIRQDFMITDIQKISSGNQNKGDWMHYRLRGSLNVPMGYRKESWSNNKVTSAYEMWNLATYCGLGFSTNFTYETCDKMKWENTLGSTYFEFMQWVAEHACYSPNTFFTAFVDQWYVLNFVEVHALLSHGGKMTDNPAMIYSTYQQATEPKADKVDGKVDTTKDQIDVNKNDTDFFNSEQKVTYYFLTNYHLYSGWTNYIESWNEISDGYSSMSEGYKKHVTYSDYSAEGMGQNCEFIITPIDNLARDSETQDILDLPDEITPDTYIPLNLMQMNRTEYQDQNLNSVDKMAEVESYEHYGQVDTVNMFKMFYFAESHNNYQMRCLKKCGLRVTLQNFNPSIVKFSRIWVDIYDMNSFSNKEIKKDKSTVYHDEDNYYGMLLKQKNDNIINFDDDPENPMGGEGLVQLRDKDTKYKNTNYPQGNYNRSLSGWYVITEFKYIYDAYENNMKTLLTLNRIEHRPQFVSEYNIAKKAVEYYKEDNKITNIYRQCDDFYYAQGGAMAVGSTGGGVSDTDPSLTGNTENSETTPAELLGNDENCIDKSFVIYKPISKNINSAPNRKPEYLVIHYTAGASSKAGRALSVRDQFANGTASSDFSVDDRDVVQISPDIDNYSTKACGGKYAPKCGGKTHNNIPSKKFIAIETCSNLKSGTTHKIPNHSGWSFSAETLNNLVKISKVIMKKYNIPITNVIRHYDTAGKECPGIVGWNKEYLCDEQGNPTNQQNNETAWEAFKKRLQT